MDRPPTTFHNGRMAFRVLSLAVVALTLTTAAMVDPHQDDHRRKIDPALREVDRAKRIFLSLAPERETPRLPGMTVTERCGDIVTALATPEAIDALAGLDDVFSVGSDPRGFSHSDIS